MHFAPSKVAYVESLNLTCEFQSGNIETNIPQTGHFSFLGGVESLGSSADEKATRKKMSKTENTVFIRSLALRLNVKRWIRSA